MGPERIETAPEAMPVVIEQPMLSREDRSPDMEGKAKVPPREESDDRHPWAAVLVALDAGAVMTPPVTVFDRLLIVVVAAVIWAVST